MRLTKVLREHGHPISLGFLPALLSSFGQTYFIALSVPDIPRSFGLNHGAFGSIFSLATLASGLLLIWLGSLVDRMQVRAFAALAMAGLAGACVALSLTHTLELMALAIFGLRLFGQGMLSHAAVISTARLHAGVRGRAIGIATLGFQAGTAVLPALGVLFITSFGWQALWQGSAIVLLLFALAVFPYFRSCSKRTPLLRLPRQTALFCAEIF